MPVVVGSIAALAVVGFVLGLSAADDGGGVAATGDLSNAAALAGAPLASPIVLNSTEAPPPPVAEPAPPAPPAPPAAARAAARVPARQLRLDRARAVRAREVLQLLRQHVAGLEVRHHEDVRAPGHRSADPAALARKMPER